MGNSHGAKGANSAFACELNVGRVASRKTSEALGVSRCFLENQRSGARRKPKQVSPERNARSKANKRALPLTENFTAQVKFKK